VDLYHLHEKYLPPWIKQTEEIDQSVRDIMGRGDEIEDVTIRGIVKRRVERLY
jgi:adenylate kinase family enzyme